MDFLSHVAKTHGFSFNNANSSNHLVETLLFQPFAKNFSDACKSHDRFFAHGLCHKIFVFLGCWRHGRYRICWESPSEIKRAIGFFLFKEPGWKDCQLIWQIMEYNYNKSQGTWREICPLNGGCWISKWLYNLISSGSTAYSRAQYWYKVKQL